MAGAFFQDGTEDDPTSGISPLALLLSGYQQQKAQQNGALPTNAGGPNQTVASAAPPIASTPTPAAGTVAGQVPTQPAAATTDALSKPLPQAPQIDPRFAGLESMYQKDSVPTNPNDPNAKPHWWQRVLGGLTTFGAGLQHNPNAMGLGMDVINSNYNRAEQQRQARLAGEQQQLGQMEKTYGLARSQFEDEMKGATEERQRANESSLAKERAAKADKYSNAIDPATVEQDESGKWFGTTYGGDRKETGAPKGYKGDQFKAPTSYESGVYQEELARSPNDKAGALARANKRIEQTEIKKFQYKPEPTDKPLTPGEKLRKSLEVNKLNTERMKAFNKLEDNADADQKSSDSFLSKKQGIEDNFAEGLKNLDVNYNRLIFKKDGSFAREGETGAESAAQAAPAKAAPAGGEKQNASITAGPPPQAFTKGEGVVHYFKNPKTNKTEPWILKNGKPQRAQ